MILLSKIFYMYIFSLPFSSLVKSPCTFISKTVISDTAGSVKINHLIKGMAFLSLCVYTNYICVHVCVYQL